MVAVLFHHLDARLHQVHDIGKKAVHQGLLWEDEARGCLQHAREALQMLLES
jgi:hypothetical protein